MSRKRVIKEKAFSLFPGKEEDKTESVKMMMCVGAGLDVPTGRYKQGRDGYWYLNGGVGQLTGIVGGANTFKSTITHYLCTTLVERVSSVYPTSYTFYDTEINVSLDHLLDMIKDYEHIDEHSFSNGVWNVYDKSKLWLEDFVELLKTFVEERHGNSKELKTTTPWDDFEGNPVTISLPAAVSIDSMTLADTATSAEIRKKNKLGDRETKILSAHDSLNKSNLLAMLPRLATRGSVYMVTTAHLGTKGNYNQGPGKPKHKPDLPMLHPDELIKGVSPNFFYVTTNTWKAWAGPKLINPNTKCGEYVKDKHDKLKTGTDLKCVRLLLARSKTAGDAVSSIIISQGSGVDNELTCFYIIKDDGKRFGIGGTNTQQYPLVLLPDLLITRFTVRELVKERKDLRTALTITCELYQLSVYHRNLPPRFLISAEDLYEGVKEQGYSWDKILTNSRQYPVPDDHLHPVPHCSTMDLILCAVDKKPLRKVFKS